LENCAHIGEGEFESTLLEASEVQAAIEAWRSG